MAEKRLYSWSTFDAHTGWLIVEKAIIVRLVWLRAADWEWWRFSRSSVLETSPKIKQGESYLQGYPWKVVPTRQIPRNISTSGIWAKEEPIFELPLTQDLDQSTVL